MNNKNEFLTNGFTQIPNNIILAGVNLTDREFRLYSVLKCHSFGKPFCFPGRKRLSVEMNASLAKIDRIKKSLIEKGVISKKRRGQGETNIHSFKDIFFSKADESPVIGLNESQIKQKEDVVNNTKTNNYLDSQIISENSFKREHLKSENLSKTPNDIVIRSMLNNISRYFVNKGWLEKFELTEEDLKFAKEGISYYVRRYKEVSGSEHPKYRKSQLVDCFYNMADTASSLRSGGWSEINIPQIIQVVIERWFDTTSSDPNNLLLSHFIGGEDNRIFNNCFQALGMYEENEEIKYG